MCFLLPSVRSVHTRQDSIDLTLTNCFLPSAFTFYVVSQAFYVHPAPIIPLVLLAIILGLPGLLIVVTSRKLSYVGWMFIYLLSLPIWNFIFPS